MLRLTIEEGGGLTYLECPSLQQADLVVLREVTESWYSLGELHDLTDSRREAHGELLPDLVT